MKKTMPILFALLSLSAANSASASGSRNFQTRQAICSNITNPHYYIGGAQEYYAACMQSSASDAMVAQCTSDAFHVIQLIGGGSHIDFDRNYPTCLKSAESFSASESNNSSSDSGAGGNSNQPAAPTPSKKIWGEVNKEVVFKNVTRRAGGELLEIALRDSTQVSMISFAMSGNASSIRIRSVQLVAESGQRYTLAHDFGKISKDILFENSDKIKIDEQIKYVLIQAESNGGLGNLKVTPF
jgi:hypothetical protein